MQLELKDVQGRVPGTAHTSANSGIGTARHTPEELAHIVSQFAASDGWLERVRLSRGHRWYERLRHTPAYDIWVISWMPGQSTGFHDHGDSAGAFVVATGALEEHRAGKPALTILPGRPRSFGREWAHDVRNVSGAPAISVHAYSPPLSEMTRYELDGDHLVPREQHQGAAEDHDAQWSAPTAQASDEARATGIEQMLAAARARLDRLSPAQAYEAVTKCGAILVDIRPEGQRAWEGSIPDALLVERNVLEWRFDPTSEARLPIATDHNLQVIVFCSEGYTSSLAAAALQSLGLGRATDIVGGFSAWQKTGLPTVS